MSVPGSRIACQSTRSRAARSRRGCSRSAEDICERAGKGGVKRRFGNAPRRCIKKRAGTSSNSRRHRCQLQRFDVVVPSRSVQWKGGSSHSSAPCQLFDLPLASTPLDNVCDDTLINICSVFPIHQLARCARPLHAEPTHPASDQTLESTGKKGWDVNLRN